MWGLFQKPWNKDPVMKQPLFYGKYPRIFFSWLKLSTLQNLISLQPRQNLKPQTFSPWIHCLTFDVPNMFSTVEVFEPNKSTQLGFVFLGDFLTDSSPWYINHQWNPPFREYFFMFPKQQIQPNPTQPNHRGNKKYEKKSEALRFNRPPEAVSVQ